MKELKIVFMGTPEFAVTILDGMIKEGANVLAVITAPDKKAGRGRKISESAVKKYAINHDIHILQPTNLKDEGFISNLSCLDADLFVVVAFRMLPEVVWGMPRKGTINLHASLLPQYRGAAPINWAIINGEKKTGVTTFFIEKEIDTGKIIRSAEMEISENMTAGFLHDKLSIIGVNAVNQTLTEIANGKVRPQEQAINPVEELKSAPKIFKIDCEIDWNSSTIGIHNFIRGLDPYPGAWSKVCFKGKEMNCKFFGSKLSNTKLMDSLPAKDQPESFQFPTSDGEISVMEIQIEGKRRMNFKEFTAGNDLNDLVMIY